MLHRKQTVLSSIDKPTQTNSTNVKLKERCSDADAAHFRQKAGSLMQHRGLMTTEKYGGIARRPKLASKRSPQGNGHSSWIHIMNVAIGGTATQEVALTHVARTLAPPGLASYLLLQPTNSLGQIYPRSVCVSYSRAWETHPLCRRWVSRAIILGTHRRRSHRTTSYSMLTFQDSQFSPRFPRSRHSGCKIG